MSTDRSIDALLGPRNEKTSLVTLFESGDASVNEAACRQFIHEGNLPFGRHASVGTQLLEALTAPAESRWNAAAASALTALHSVANPEVQASIERRTVEAMHPKSALGPSAQAAPAPWHSHLLKPGLATPVTSSLSPRAGPKPLPPIQPGKGPGLTR